jgi:hypothetical protein
MQNLLTSALYHAFQSKFSSMLVFFFRCTFMNFAQNAEFVNVSIVSCISIQVNFNVCFPFSMHIYEFCSNVEYVDVNIIFKLFDMFLTEFNKKLQCDLTNAQFY